MLFFGVCFFLYFIKLSAGNGFWTNLRHGDPTTHKLAIQYQRSLRRLTKAELDLAFLRRCKQSDVYPKFIRWRKIKQMKRKKKQQRIHKLLLNDAINERNANISHLRKTTDELKNAVFDKTTWMKARLIVLSVNRLLSGERKKATTVTTRHSQKLQRLLDMKTEKLETNPNEVIVNLSGKSLTAEQIEILKLGLRHGLATRPNSLEMTAVSEDIYDQLAGQKTSTTSWQGRRQNSRAPGQNFIRGPYDVIIFKQRN